MEINNTCRICLVVHKPMVRLGDTGKKKFIESIFRQNGFRYNLNAKHQICYICDALLSKSWNFIERVLRAQRILEKLMSEHQLLTIARLQKIDRCKEKLNYTDLAVQSIATVGVTENTVQEKQIYLDIVKQEVKQEPDNQLLGQNSMDDVYEDPPVDEFADVFEINSSNIICVNTDESLGTKETNTVVSVDPLAIDNLSIKETDPNYNIFFPTKQEKLSGLSRELKKKSTLLETKKNALSTEIENRSGFPKNHSLVIETEDLSIPTAVRTQSDEYQNCVKIDIEIDGTVSFEQSIDESNALIISSESDRDKEQKDATGFVSKKGKKSASILHNEVESVSGDAAESALILHNELASVMSDDTLAVAPSPKNIQKIKKVTPKPAKPKPVKRILYRSEESDLTETEDEVTNKRKSSDEDYNPDEYSESSDSVDERVFPTTCDENRPIAELLARKRKLTELCDKKSKASRKRMNEADENDDPCFATPLSNSSLLRNISNDDPLSSLPVATQQLYNVLITDPKQQFDNTSDIIENNEASEENELFLDDSDDSVHDPVTNIVVDLSETDCESCDDKKSESKVKSIPISAENAIETRIMTSKKNTKDIMHNLEVNLECKNIIISSLNRKETQHMSLDNIQNKEAESLTCVLNEKTGERIVAPEINMDEDVKNTEHENAAPTIDELETPTMILERIESDISIMETARTSKERIINKGRSRVERNASKIRRNTGKSYRTEKGKVVPDRKRKELSPCRLKCSERITMAEQTNCFENYWQLGNRDRRAAFVSKSVTILPKKSQKTGSRTLNRDCYCKYMLKISNEEKPICKECFCRILGETKGFVNIVIENKKLSPNGIIDEDQRGRQPLSNSSLLRNKSNDDPLSPLPAMSPANQQLYNVLITDPKLQFDNNSDIIENSDASEENELFLDDSNDSVHDPDFNIKKIFVDDSETGWESFNDEKTESKVKSIPISGEIAIETRIMTSKKNTKDIMHNIEVNLECKNIIISSLNRKETQPMSLDNIQNKEAESLTCVSNEKTGERIVAPEINMEEDVRNTEHGNAAPTIDELETPTMILQRIESDISIMETASTSKERTSKGRSRVERNVSKLRRNTGKSYRTEKGKVIPDRKRKELSPCRLKCAERITMAEQTNCFENYWQLGNRDRRAAFVSKSVTILPKKSQKPGSRTLNRDCYCKYMLKISNEEKPICKECFCRILGETKGFVNIVIENKKLSPNGIIDEDQRGRQPLSNSSLLRNISNDDPLSPLPAMSPANQQLYNVLITDPKLQFDNNSDIIENSDASEENELFLDDSNDSVHDPDFNIKKILVDDSETGWESFNDEKTESKVKSIPISGENATETRIMTSKKNTKDIMHNIEVNLECKNIIISSLNRKETKHMSLDNIQNKEAESLTCVSNEKTGERIVAPEINMEEDVRNTEHGNAAPTIDELETPTMILERIESDISIMETASTSKERTSKGRSRVERNVSKLRRNTGKSYRTEKGKVIPDRKRKELSPCRLKCAERITMAEQTNCFENYWQLGNRDRRAAFVSKSVTILPKKSQKPGSRTLNRDCYCKYMLKISNEEKPICKECFCRILGETKGFVNIVIENKKLSPNGIIDEDQRGRQPPKNKKTIEDISLVNHHILRFLSYESHYCRKSTGKKYLAADLSIAKMYRDYKDTSSNPVSLKLFTKCFHDLSLSFKQQSKDTCNTCDVLNAKIKVADEDHKITLTAE